VSKAEAPIKPEGTPIMSLKAKEFLLYSKIYRFFAFLTAIIGFIISGVIYDKISDGSFLILLERPIVITYLFAPFIPAAFLAFLAHSKLKKFYKQAQKDGIDINSLRKRSDLYSHKNVKQH